MNVDTEPRFIRLLISQDQDPKSFTKTFAIEDFCYLVWPWFLICLNSTTQLIKMPTITMPSIRVICFANAIHHMVLYGIAAAVAIWFRNTGLQKLTQNDAALYTVSTELFVRNSPESPRLPVTWLWKTLLLEALHKPLLHFMLFFSKTFCRTQIVGI